MNDVGQGEEDEVMVEPETFQDEEAERNSTTREEEKSLFEPPPTPEPPPLPKTMPEESSGPKARLVIHKMALVNLKSYARHREIGPFHKVSFRSIIVLGLNYTHYSPSHFLLSSDLMDQASLTIDALLFVFGYRTPKMRQATLTEVIHNSPRHQTSANIGSTLERLSTW